MRRFLLLSGLLTIRAQNDTTTTEAETTTTTTGETTTSTTGDTTTSTTGDATTTTTMMATTTTTMMATTTTAAATTTMASSSSTGTTTTTMASSSSTGIATTAMASSSSSSGGNATQAAPQTVTLVATPELCSSVAMTEQQFKTLMCTACTGAQFDSTGAGLNATFVDPTGVTCVLASFVANGGTCTRRQRRGRQLSGGVKQSGEVTVTVDSATASPAAFTAAKAIVDVATGAGANTAVNAALQTAIVLAVAPVSASAKADMGLPANTADLSSMTTTGATGTTAAGSTTTTTGGSSSSAATMFVGQIFAMMVAYLYVSF